MCFFTEAATEKTWTGSVLKCCKHFKWSKVKESKLSLGFVSNLLVLVSVSDQNSFSLYSLDLLCSVSEILLKYTSNRLGNRIPRESSNACHGPVQSNALPRHSNCACTCVQEESLSNRPPVLEVSVVERQKWMEKKSWGRRVMLAQFRKCADFLYLLRRLL